MKLSHGWSKPKPVFDEENLGSAAGLVPVMGLAQKAGLSALIADKITLTSTRVKSAAVNPPGKITSIVAGMAAGADSIEGLGVVRSGGMKQFFEQVYASATLGQLLREFTGGHVAQLASVARAHLVGLCARTDLLPGCAEQVFIDIDSLLCPVYGHAKKGASLVNYPGAVPDPEVNSRHADPPRTSACRRRCRARSPRCGRARAAPATTASRCRNRRSSRRRRRPARR